MSTDACRGMYKDAHRSPYTDTHICRSTCKDDSIIKCKEDSVSAYVDVTCMEDCISVCMEVSTDSTGVHRSTCPYICTKDTGVHVVTSTKKYKVKTFICGSMKTYDKYGRYKPIRDIGPYILGKVGKGIRYADALRQGY